MDHDAYQEVISVTVTDTLQQDGPQLQARLTKVLQTLAKLAKLTVQVLPGKAAEVLQGLARLVMGLAKPVMIVLNLLDHATAPIRALMSSLANVARKGIMIPIRMAGAALNAGGLLAARSLGGPGAEMAMGFAEQVLPPGMQAAVGAAGIFAAGVGAAAQFDNALVNVQNNTNMSTADLAVLHDTVLQLGQASGASFEQLTQGGMKAMNIVGDMTAAMQILDVAQQSAVSTGADVAMVTQVLANAMHEYAMDTGNAATVQANAAHVMGVMHQAAAMSNMTLEQFSDASGRAIGVAANLGIPLEDVAAAFVALTKHGYDAAQAQTQIVDAMTHSINPTQQQLAAIRALQSQSGVNLLGDFTAQGLSDKGLTGLLNDLTLAYERTGLSSAKATGESMKLINALRGGLGLATLLGTGQDDYNRALNAFGDEASIDSLTSDSLARTQGTLGNQMAKIGNIIGATAITLGEKLLPTLIPLAQQFADNLPAAIDATLAMLQPFGDALQALFSGDMAGAIDSLGQGFANIGDALSPMLPAVEAWWTGTFVPWWTAVAWPALQPAITALFSQVGGSIVASLGQTIGEAFNQLGTIANLAVALVEKVVAAVVNYVITTGQYQMAYGVGYWVQTFVNWVTDAATQIPGKLEAFVQAVVAWVQRDPLGAVAKSLGDSFATAFGNAVPDWIKNAVGTAGGLAQSAQAGAAAANASLPGHATGASWIVGGGGGTDSQVVAFRATPGERVTVSTPAQQQGGGGGLVFAPVIHAEGSAAGVEERIQAILQQAQEDFWHQAAVRVRGVRRAGLAMG